MVDGGVGRGMGSNGKKGSRKEAAPKRPGPTPAQPLKKRCKADAKAAKVEKMNNHNERKKMDKLILGNLKSKDPDVWAGLQQSVVNARGRSRGFHENCLFLTLFCSLYKEAAAEMDTLCAHLATSRAPCARATRAHPCGCLAVSAARRRIHASTSRS
jgi:hypothetical protein